MPEQNSTGSHKLATLTPEEKAEWEYYLAWYRNNGWGGTDALENAWRDLQKKYPRLKPYVAPQ